MNRTVKIILCAVGAIGLLVATVVVGLIVLLYFTNRTFDQTLAANLNVSSEWTEIRAEPPLRTRRNVAELELTIPNYRNDRGSAFEIRLPDGRIVRPQIEVVDTDGNVYDLKHSGFTYIGDKVLITFSPEGGFPQASYSKLRIRSDEAFMCERIFWREWNPK